MDPAHRLPSSARHRGGASGADAPGLVVLDLDGTLVELELDWGAVRSALRARAATAGIAVRDARVQPLLARARAQAPRVAEQLEAWLGDLEAAAARRCRVNRALLAWLAERPDAPLAICTSSGRACVGPALAAAGLAERVVAVVAREDVRAWKPNPEGLLALLARTGAPPERALFIGDRATDAAAGRAAGVPVLDVGAIGLDWRAAA
ncbi:MAG: HAD family hydrolase [Thermoleophilaceae bacterium]|nr:HAD family hydrolase [Thermoleophilaceae bacterium]